MSHWQPVVSRIAKGEISAERYSAELEVPTPDHLIETPQIVPLTEAEFLEDGGSLSLTFIPEKLTLYACAYQQFFSPIRLYLVDKKEDKRELVEEFSMFLIPNIQEENEGIRFVSLNSRLKGVVNPLKDDEKVLLETENQSPPAFKSLSGQTLIGMIGSIKKVIIRLGFS